MEGGKKRQAEGGRRGGEVVWNTPALSHADKDKILIKTFTAQTKFSTYNSSLPDGIVFNYNSFKKLANS